MLTHHKFLVPSAAPFDDVTSRKEVRRFRHFLMFKMAADRGTLVAVIVCLLSVTLGGYCVEFKHLNVDDHFGEEGLCWCSTPCPNRHVMKANMRDMAGT